MKSKIDDLLSKIPFHLQKFATCNISTCYLSTPRTNILCHRLKLSIIVQETTLMMFFLTNMLVFTVLFSNTILLHVVSLYMLYIIYLLYIIYIIYLYICCICCILFLFVIYYYCCCLSFQPQKPNRVYKSKL